jgi:hypothetical protein
MFSLSHPWSDTMAIHLDSKNLRNVRQMDVTVNGPDGATHLILCVGIADPGILRHTTYTFLVGPRLLRRQFVGAIASGALSRIHIHSRSLNDGGSAMDLAASLGSIDAGFEEESGQVRVQAEILSIANIDQLAISYTVHILAEMTLY